jgi:RNA polymerase sigma factor for flagellar operon FliA
MDTLVSSSSSRSSSRSASPAASIHQAAFVESLPVIRDVVRAVCINHHVSPEEEQELAQSVHIKLMSNDYRVFRQFRGRGTLRTFLYSVISRHLIDRRNVEWGRFRPSKRARVLGSAAVCLEKLVYRDGAAVRDAMTQVANTPRWALTSGDVRKLYAQLPQRAPAYRRPEPIEAIVNQVADDNMDAAQRDQHRSEAVRVRLALMRVLQALTREERRLLRLRFQEGLSIADIAAAAGEEPQALYRRFARLLKQLRTALEAQDLTEEAIQTLLGTAGEELDALLQQMCHSQA